MSIKIVFRVKNPQIKAVQPARILISLYVIYILLPHTPLLNVVPFDVRLHVTYILLPHTPSCQKVSNSTPLYVALILLPHTHKVLNP